MKGIWPQDNRRGYPIFKYYEEYSHIQFPELDDKKIHNNINKMIDLIIKTFQRAGIINEVKSMLELIGLA